MRVWGSDTMKKTRILLVALIFLLHETIPTVLFAKGAGSSGGLSLLTSYSARSAALGEALTASINDISAFGANPASLSTLKTGQASFLYQKGLVDDAYGHFAVGSPLRNKNSVGFALGYYNGGSLEYTDEAGKDQSVTAERDLTLSMGFSRNMGPFVFGFTGKYINAELAETARAHAFAGDAGLQFPINSRVRMGMALQNYGTKLKFIEEGDNLPRVARMGISYLLARGEYPTTLLFDIPYMMNERQVIPSAGLEVLVGPLALRAGYRGGDSREFTLGTGFVMGATSLDYSFGLIQDFDSQHKVSMAMRFGGTRADNYFSTPAPVKRPQAIQPVKTKVTAPATKAKPVASKSSSKKSAVKSSKSTKSSAAKSSAAKSKKTASIATTVKKASTSQKKRVYVVKRGETLASIAKREYGLASQWKAIYLANKHLLQDPTQVDPGQKIVLP